MTDELAMLHSTAVLVLLATASLGIGGLAATIGKLRISDRIERLVWEASLGLLLVTTGLGWLGQFGLLHRGTIVGGTCLAAILGCVRLWKETASATAPTSTGETVDEPPRWIRLGLGIAAGITITATFLSALAPPTAGDALVYHLELPKRFLQAGGLTFNPDDENITYPLVAEMGFLWALALDDASAPALLHWGCGLLLAGATYLLAKPYVGRGWAGVAAGLAILTPGVNNQMTAPLNDVALALFAVLALAAWLPARRNGGPRDFALVGLMLGGAIGVKYTGLLFAASLGAVWLVAAVSDLGRRRQLLHGAVIAAIVLCVTAGLWYGRAAWHRGDPLYPFLTRQADPAGLEAFPEKKTPLGRGPTALLTAPWSLTMEPARFGGRSHQLGPLFLMFVPVALACRGAAAVSTPLLIAAIYGGGCLLLRQNVRFLLPIVPILATAIVAAWRTLRVWPRGPTRLIAATTAAVVLFLAVIPIARLRHTAAATLGGETFVEYLRRTEPTYAPAEWINAHLPPESRILSEEQRAFYLTPAVTRESLYRRRTQYHLRLEDPLARWKNDGFTHWLTMEGGSSSDHAESPANDERSATIGPEPFAETVVVQQWRHVDDAGIERHYVLRRIP